MMPAILVDLPWALALIAPALVAWWRWGRGPGRWWRFIAVLLLAIAAAGPRWVDGRGGADVVLVLDRSASMGRALAGQDELAATAAGQRGRGDRLAVVVAADGVAIAQAPRAQGRDRLADADLPEGASDLAGGLELAASLIAPGRSARVLVHSDGEATGRDPGPAAARLAALGAIVDVLAEAPPPLPDAAVVAVEVPGALRLGESFIGAAVLVGERVEERAWRVLRADARGGAAGGEREIAAGRVALRADVPATVTFADRPDAGGVAEYRIELDAEGDRRPGNNTARAAVRVEGGERVLVMSRSANIAAAIRATGLTVDAMEPGPLPVARLAGVRAVVLDDVAADDLGTTSLRDLASWVEHLGGGLLMLGGRSSFGAGGYRRSPVEDVLPVTLELRDESRRPSLALAIALDRSGSMSMPAGGGRTKMDLADAGACAAIELLSPRDSVAVYAVDSAPHEVVAMTRITDPAAITRKVRGIVSQGGGIYVYEALVAGGRALAGSSAGTRHLVLFADAADAEEPGDYRRLLEQFRAGGITVSVIGMGSDADSDAELLKDVARRGGGRITFARDPDDMPRLFAQETMLVARTAWVEGPAALRPEPTAAVALRLPAGPWPQVMGYNLGYARPRAEVLATAMGDPQAPAVARWRIGTGRAAVIALDCDAAEESALRDWPGCAPLIAGLARWCAGDGDQAPGVLNAVRRGRGVDLRLELDPAQRARWPATAPRAALVGGPAQAAVALHAVDDGVWVGRFDLPDAATVIPAVAIGDSALAGPACRLPYAPEDEPRLGRRPGIDLIAEIARLGGGAMRTDLSGLYRLPPSPGRPLALAPWLLALAVAIMVMEIACRRLRWSPWESVRAMAGRMGGRWRMRRPGQGHDQGYGQPGGQGLGQEHAGRPGNDQAEGSPLPPGHAPADPPVAPPPVPAAPAASPAAGLSDALEKLKQRRR